MISNGRLFHRVDGLIAQENGEEKLAETHTLNPGLATNLHFELIRNVFQNDEEYNKLETAYIMKIDKFLSQQISYAQLLYTARELVQQEITQKGLTRREIIVQFANIEPTARTNREHQTFRG